MIKQGVLSVNVLIACFYLVTIGIVMFVIKKSNRPLVRYQPKQKQKQKDKQKIQAEINYQQIIALAYLKKYTLPGSCMLDDKKYLLKQFLFIAAYAVSCLNINHIILWPVGLSLAILVLTFLLWDVVLKTIESKLKETPQNKVNIEQKPVESQLQIAADIIQPTINVVQIGNPLEEVKVYAKINRNIYEIVMVVVVGFVSLLMMLQTVMYLGMSVSNSGELNILSLMTIIAIDQLGVRVGVGLVLWSACKIMIEIRNRQEQPEIQSVFISLLCYEELTDILIQTEKERIKKEQEMTASPPKKKTTSPSRIPKALLHSADKQTYLNLINLQPTSRNGQEEVIEQIYLTSAEKDLFADHNFNKSSFYTKRLRNIQNRDVASYSANKGTTIDFNDKKDFDDLLIFKADPFHEIENIPSGEFFLQDSEVRRTKRRGYKKKNKRNLKLTGNSPYLEYLPDMLKKVDQFKHINTTGKEKQKEKESEKERQIKIL